MNRISHIEGLRAWLAFWVVYDHVLGVSGFSIAALSGFLKIIRQGSLAVDIFIIISGFVIFYLLDHRNEGYYSFIVRRFFRLWPLYIILFVVSIPLSLLFLANANSLNALFPEAVVGDGLIAETVQSWWDNIFLHIALHVPMLHGIVPESVLPNAPSAFLGAAWSISLEWQFYLLAPLVYNLLTRYKWGVPVVSAITLAICLFRQAIPAVQFGAFLPMHIEYFYLGGLSYFIFNWNGWQSCSINLLPLGLAFAVLLLFLVAADPNYIPLAIWSVFFSLLIDANRDKRRPHVDYAGWLFNNAVALYLGRISYSIYLGHFPVIILCQFLILEFLPSLSMQQHVLLLTVIVTAVTIVVSHGLYTLVEVPGMNIGKKIKRVSVD